MNFFEQQTRARRHTTQLLVLFVLAVVLLATGIYFAARGALGVLSWRSDPTGPVVESWWDPEIFLAFFLGTLAVVFLASLARTGQLRRGGPAVAEMLGGQLVPPGTRDRLERRLLNVVEEMAIAAAVPVPQVYVLPGEQGINAFAAGHAPQDAAVAVTRGCLETLDRDELQGVIAHEFSHILNGDMRLNIRLMGVLFGILVIGVIGRGVLHFTRFSGGSRRGRGGGGGGLVAAVLLIGVILMILGYIGLFFGRLIRAAVSRQREFLADAAAVQFTRQPRGIAGALKKIGGYVHGSRVQAPAAEETSHFFFGSAQSFQLFAGWFATHPPLVERIQRIEPDFRGDFPKVAAHAAAVPAAGAAAPGAAAGLAAAPSAAAVAPRTRPRMAPAAPAASGELTVAPEAVVRQVGRPRPEHARYAAALLRALPVALHQGVQDTFSACAIIYALLLSDEASVHRAQTEQIRQQAGPALLRETLRFSAALTDFEPRWMLPLATLTLPALRQLTVGQQGQFVATTEALIAADAEISLFEFAITRTVLRNLAAARTPGARAGKVVRSLAPLLEECRLLLSTLAHQGQSTPEAVQRAFAAGIVHLREPAAAHLTLADAAPLAQVDRALDRLRATPPRVRERVLEACAHCALIDQRVTVAEAELLRVVADALDCPVPPFVAPGT